MGGVYGGLENHFSGVTAGIHNSYSANPRTKPDFFEVPGNNWSWTGQLNRFNKVDEVNGWVRGVIITVGLWNGTRYTPTYACPVLVDVKSNIVLYGDVISSTNIVPQNIYPGNMNSVIIDNILTVFIEDADNLTGPDRYMSLTVTP